MLPWLVISAAALLLGLATKNTGVQPASSAVTPFPGGGTHTTAPSAPITSQVNTASLPPTLGLFVPITSPTNRPEGRLVGGITTEPNEPVSDADRAVAMAKQIVSYLKTAVSATLQVVAQVGSAAAQAVGAAVGSVVPLVGAVVGLGFLGADAATGEKSGDELALQGGMAVLSATPLGLVTLGITIPKAFESIAAAKHARQREIDARHEQEKSARDLVSWTPRAVELSERLDEWYLLPRLSEAHQIAWITDVNSQAKDLIQSYPQTISVAIDHIRLGEAGRGASEGIILVPGRDVTQLEQVYGRALIDAFLLQMATADFLSRKGRPYKVAEFAAGNYMIQQTAAFAGFAGMQPGNGIIPYGGNGNDPAIPAAPSLTAIQSRMSAPRWLASFVQYWEAADLVRFHGSQLYSRFLASRVKLTLDEIAAPPVMIVGPSQEQAKAEIAGVVSAVQTRNVAVQAQQDALTAQWFANMSTP